MLLVLEPTVQDSRNLAREAAQIASWTPQWILSPKENSGYLKQVYIEKTTCPCWAFADSSGVSDTEVQAPLGVGHCEILDSSWFPMCNYEKNCQDFSWLSSKIFHQQIQKTAASFKT